MAKKKPYRFALYLAARLAAGLICLLPWPVAIALGRIAGRMAYAVVWRHRRKAIENLTCAYGGEKSQAEIRSMAKKVFENMAMTVVEIIQMPKLDFEKMRRMVDAAETLENFKKLLAEGKGVILITAHLGNWELLAGVCGLAGIKGGVLARRIYYEPYNQWIVDLRRAVNITTIYRDQSAKKVFEVLHRNEVIGILPDQDVESLKGEFVPFFGRPAYTTVAPAKMALATGAPVMTSFLIRQSGGRFKFLTADILRPVVRISKEEALRECTAAWMSSVENMIRQYPEQWAWMHNRWKTQPAEESAEESLETRKAAS